MAIDFSASLRWHKGYMTTKPIDFRSHQLLDELPRYETVVGDMWELRTFYWTIRAMTGPKVAALRKSMRDRHGRSLVR